MNDSQAERFAELYRRLWAAFHLPDAPDLAQHERQVLHHVPAGGGIALIELARHVALPMSTASVLAKDLERRGFLRRSRDPSDERRLRIVLTTKGCRRVERDTVLDVRKLRNAMGSLTPTEREHLLEAMGRLARAGEGSHVQAPAVRAASR